ncbi:TetR/AcrR family transcriptional regulator [Intestinibacter bartlettii]|uniref:TetR/AcrR family transcriptional regulator n=1 Tax=Intestinibacter bartlettii TaxID=261299 RepID=A0ABS6E0V3_9FIRM|nr:TetR/AcrR family transcriptional regulator [Intestinibacter bartlettii]MBU5337248.1 TetR/AcrR family transcriptional regulator [Intestinibacter bartlettii]MDO5009737.1 TetR/AcrR family transcriptional regulator [Intestinibacter bartlettii]
MQHSILDLYKKDILENKTMTAKCKRILETSIDLFAKNGYANTSTSEIAKIAGVAEGTIFKHFGTKQNLLLSSIMPFIFNYVLPEIILDFDDIEISDIYPDFKSFIHELVYERFSFMSENYKVAHILLAEVLYREELRVQIVDSLKSNIMDNFDKILDYFKSQKMIKNVPNGLIVRTVLSNIGGYVILKYILDPDGNYNDDKELKYIEELIVDAFSL